MFFLSGAASLEQQDIWYLFGDDMLIHFALHFLKPTSNRGQLSSPDRLVENLLAVSFQRQKCDTTENI